MSVHSNTFSRFTFHYNGDGSGDVILHPNMRPDERTSVPMRDLVDFVGSFAIGREVSRLESMEPALFLGFTAEFDRSSPPASADTPRTA